MRASKSKYYEFQEFSLAYLTSTDSIVSSSSTTKILLAFCLWEGFVLSTIEALLFLNWVHINIISWVTKYEVEF